MRPKAVEALQKKYNLSKIEACKAHMLLLWFKNEKKNPMLVEEFDRRYKWLFIERPFWYTWGPFYRDHGYVGLRK